MARSYLKGIFLAAIVGMALAPLPGHAAIVNHGVLDAGDARAFWPATLLYGQNTAFDDQFRFSVNQLSGVSLLGTRPSSPPIGGGVPPLLEIQGFEVGLYRLDPGDILTLLAPSTQIGDIFTLNYASLATGMTYLFRASGLVTGQLGTYNGNYSVTAVPLPPALILLGSALLGLALFGRIRRTVP